MKIEHFGIWVTDLERMKACYEKYFNMPGLASRCRVASDKISTCNGFSLWL